MFTELTIRSDRKGLIQCLGVLAVSSVTGALTFWTWTHGWKWAALVALVIHGNVCSLWISAVHELAHGTVFKTRFLNRVFSKVFGFLNWMDRDRYMSTHASHHTHTLTEHDLELPGACRPLWFGTWLWSAVFNFPKFVVSAARCPLWIIFAQCVLATAFVMFGVWQLVVIVNLAPFWFGWLEILVNYPQHAGMKIGADDMRDKVRTMDLPGWLSFLNWHMEFHLEHHMEPAIPCYNLKAFRMVIYDALPASETLLQAWLSILSGPLGRCGDGVNPIRGFIARFLFNNRNATISDDLK